jgi:polar amino acid transport system substrate-binding protein
VISSRLRIACVLAAAAIVAGACSSAATPSPAPATVAPATVAPATVAPATVAPATAVPLPTVPTNELIKAGTLTVCSDTSYPPQESLDSSNNAIGSDIDLAKEIAKRLGLTLSVKSTVFDTIIPALTGGSCDIIISAQTITAEREQAVDMVPYFAAGQSFVVLAGNPDNINTIDDLCGQAVAAEKGTIEADHIAGTGSGYNNKNSLDANCKTKGKAQIALKVFDADTSALLALQSGVVVAHFTDEPVAGYEVAQGSGKFQMIPSMTLERGAEGISVTKNHPELRDAVKAALLSMIDDGTYLQILTKWGVQSGAITDADVNATPAPAAS